MNNKKALTKLLQSTNLREESERIEVLELMDSWAEIDIDDALELLGSTFKNLSVRSYAVNRLKKASDKETRTLFTTISRSGLFRKSLYIF